MLTNLFQRLFAYFNELWEGFCRLVGDVWQWLWSNISSAVVSFCEWLWTFLKEAWAYITNGITDWSIQLIGYLLQAIPGLDVDTGNSIEVIRENFEQWNHFLPINELIACATVFTSAYLIAITWKIVIFVYDKVAALIP